jgi:hypothetical protein
MSMSVESPPTIAHCIVGTAFESQWGLEHNKLPIYTQKGESAGHLPWLRAVRGGHESGRIDVDLFMVLETRQMPRRSDFFVNGKDIDGGGGGELAWLRAQQAAHGPNSSAWPWNRTNPSLLEPMIRALKPTRTVIYEANLQCAESPCLCGHGVHKGPTMGYWEMMAKNTACFHAIQEQERRNNRTYDFVSKTRTDAPFMTASVVRRAALSKNQPFDAIGISNSMNECHGGGDWAAFMPRRLAPAYFGMCDEITCGFVRKHGTTKCSWAVESYLWSWAEQHPLHPRVMHLH